ncbi:hypothetical protein Z948_1321 [Sulfitobacter donghicola DSW-25 = KCTC 12864 = JCM 14565]|nr:hypothetical protein Z948_1321 [Sulfitobacter donghicola DSW-25 = KCTC 12864 = JCM 14565]
MPKLACDQGVMQGEEAPAPLGQSFSNREDYGLCLEFVAQR